MNLIEQYLAESADNHDEAVKHIHAAHGHNDVRNFHTDAAKQTGAAGVSKDGFKKAHDSHVAAGFKHKSNKAGDVHVYKKGNTTVTHYHGDHDINVHTKK